MSDLDSIQKKYQELLNQLSDPELISQREQFEDLMRKKKQMESIIEKQKEIDVIQKQIQENRAILGSEQEAELIVLAENELRQLQIKEQMLQKELDQFLKEQPSQNEYRAVIIEIRAGTGGEEAALFAGDLFQMYSKFAALQGWRLKVLDSHPSDLKGFKEIIFQLEGPDVYRLIRHEGGVHRVQRIPETEKAGRIHTSTATVAILPKPKSTEIKIRPDHIKTDYYHSSGPGGQYVNKRETAVRITHLPTGIVVTSQSERNQIQNKENALAILAARLLEQQEKSQQEQIAGNRKSQIGGAKRAEKIRTYNFPQDRLTDHRLKKSWRHLDAIMGGELEEIVKTLNTNNEKV